MVRKKRRWLCQGCTYAPPEGVIEEMIHCGAVGKQIPAIPHVRYMKYESCPNRQEVKAEQASFLRELTRRIAAEAPGKPGDSFPERRAAIERIEIELKEKWKES